MNFIKCGVIGHPIAHSKSPLIHNHWIKKYNLSGEYRAIDIGPDNLKHSVQRLIDEEYTGFNVTVPHKQVIFDLCSEVDQTAEHIGAVNTVIVRDGKLFGTNTDAYGFIENLKQNARGVDFGGKIFVLGAGGAARAVVYGLIEAGAQNIVITNRTVEKSWELCTINPDIVKYVEWDVRNAELEGSALLVNTTSLGMKGKPPLEIDLSALPVSAVVNDIVYAPLMTDLLVQAQNRGNKVVTGIGMLLHQARPAFEKWFGVLPGVDSELEKKVLA